MRVYKYPLAQKSVSLELPRGAKIIAVAQQGWNPTIWAEVDPGVEATDFRYFRIVGTGEDIESGYTHLGTCFDDGLVWHVYEQSFDAVESEKP